MTLPAAMNEPSAGARNSNELRRKPNRKPRRPLSVTITGAVVLSLAALHGVRLVLALVNWDFLRSLLPFSPAYLALSGAVWGALFSVCAWRLWRGLRYGRELTLAVTLLFFVYFWLDRALLAANPDRNINWPFVLGASLIWLAWLTWTFSRSKVRSFFER